MQLCYQLLAAAARTAASQHCSTPTAMQQQNEMQRRSPLSFPSTAQQLLLAIWFCSTPVAMLHQSQMLPILRLKPTPCRCRPISYSHCTYSHPHWQHQHLLLKFECKYTHACALTHELHCTVCGGLPVCTHACTEALFSQLHLAVHMQWLMDNTQHVEQST